MLIVVLDCHERGEQRPERELTLRIPVINAVRLVEEQRYSAALGLSNLTDMRQSNP